MTERIRGISVVVPVYNMEKYLGACLDSLVNQSLQDIEIIVVDDGSTDESPNIIKRYEKQYPEKIHAYRKANGGQASARNLGIRESQREYVGFVDSDDEVDTNMFEDMYLEAKKEDADMVECNYIYCKMEGDKRVPLNRYVEIKPKKQLSELFLNPLVSPWNKIIRAAIIEESGVVFPEGLIYEDTAFYIQLIPYLKKVTYVDKEYVYHYQRSNSTVTTKQSPKVGNMLDIIEGIIAYYYKHGFYEKYRYELEYFCVKILLCSSLGRIALLKDKKAKKKYITKTIYILDSHFPMYRRNPYLKVGWNAQYLKFFHRRMIKLYEFVAALMYKRKMQM